MRKKRILTGLLLICVMVFAGFLTMLVKTLIPYGEADEVYEEIGLASVQIASESRKEPSDSEQGTVVPEICPIAVDFQVLEKLNPDIVGWIYGENTKVNYPVVQGKDNDYYLHRDLNGQKSTAGTIFLDYADRADFSSLHNVLYGHHMKNGSMFKDISRYKDQGYFDQHSEIILYTPEREIHLKALAAVCTSPDAIRRKTEFASGEEFASYIQQMTAGASASAPVEGTIVRLYSFVTCSYEFNNARTILYAYESAE